MDKETARRVRMYFHNSKEMQRVANYRGLEMKMSAHLRGEYAAKGNRQWIMRIWYMGNCGDRCMVAISRQLQPVAFAPREPLDIRDTLYINRRGVAAKLGRPLSKGAVWGEAFVLTSEWLKDANFASALTYVEVLTLSQGALFETVEAFPEEKKEIRRAVVFYTAQRAMMLFAKKYSEQKKKNLSATDPFAVSAKHFSRATLMEVSAVGEKAEMYYTQSTSDMMTEILSRVKDIGLETRVAIARLGERVDDLSDRLIESLPSGDSGGPGGAAGLAARPAPAAAAAAAGGPPRKDAPRMLPPLGVSTGPVNELE